MHSGLRTTLPWASVGLPWASVGWPAHVDRPDPGRVAVPALIAGLLAPAPAQGDAHHRGGVGAGGRRAHAELERALAQRLQVPFRPGVVRLALRRAVVAVERREERRGPQRR